MKTYKYAIIGGGMAADAAVDGIREADPQGSIGIFSKEGDPPYDRPPLTKALWKGDPFESIWRKTESKGVDLHLNYPISRIDPANKRIVGAEEFGYEKLLLATGVSPRTLGFGEGILYYRTAADYKKLREVIQNGKRCLAIGGGFIGSELGAALTMNERQVTMAFPGKGIASNIYPADLSDFVTNYYREKGVTVLPETNVVGCERRGSEYVVSFEGGITEATFDVVIAGVGTTPNVELAKEAGLDVENGIKVNGALQTSHPDIYAAGDVALFHDVVLDQWRRVEHEDNANTMGKAAGSSMAGQAITYDHSPFYYSDLFDLGYEAVGELDSRLETVSDWKEPFREGVVYYLRDGRLRGVLLWNVWEQVDAARRLIAAPGPFAERIPI